MSETKNQNTSIKVSQAKEIVIRRAEKEDCKSMMTLIHELALYEKAPEEVTVNFDHFVESGFGEKPVWWAFVASSPLPSPQSGEGVAESEAEASPNPTGGRGHAEASPNPSGGGEHAEIEASHPDKIVGFALYYIRYSTWKGQRLYLEDLLVTEEMRGKEIGKLLFDRLIEECKEKKFSGMMWQVLDWNEPAINFYKKFNANLDPEWINGSLNF